MTFKESGRIGHVKTNGANVTGISRESKTRDAVENQSSIGLFEGGPILSTGSLAEYEHAWSTIAPRRVVWCNQTYMLIRMV